MKREMVLVPYDEGWAEQFEQIKAELKGIFGDLALDIRHFGSTSVKGMSAKPIIDVMVIVGDICKVDALNERMKAAGYVSKGENGIEGRRYFQKFAEDGVNHAQHIHCYEKDHPHAAEELMFRDYLSENQEAFDAYLKVKTEAAEKFRFSPVEYTEYKTACVKEILEKAKHYYEKSEREIKMETMIRDLVTEDMPQLAALYEQFWGDKSDVEKMKKAFAVIQAENRHIILIAERNGIVTGSVMGIVCRELYGDCRPFLVVENMIVDRRSRRDGVGFRLLSALERRARDRDCTQMILVTETDRADACAFYEKYGFQKNNKGYKQKL